MTAALEFMASDGALASLESTLETATGSSRLPALVAVAWQLRQRDTTRALALCAEIDRLLESSVANSEDNAPPFADQRQHAARLMLIRGEADWLFARLPSSLALAARALHAFSALDDARGRADAHWLQAMLAIDQGNRALRDTELHAMADAARGHDPDRTDVAEAALALNATFSDPAAAKDRWGTRFANGQTELHPAAACWAEDFWGQHANLTSNFAPAVRHFVEVHALALASGQMRRAIIAATNTGAALVNLSDFHTALEWTQRGLAIARRTGWPGSIAITLQQTAATLRQLQRLDAAREMLREALELMVPLAASRNYAITLWFLGEVELDSKDFASALKTYQLMTERADVLGQPDLQSYARCGQARALGILGQPQQALAEAMAAQELGKDSPGHQIEVLKLLADIHAAHTLDAPPGITAASVPLHYLQQALDLSASIEGLTIPGELLEAVAREYARVGHYQQAYDYSQQALAARQKTHHLEASNRAVAMQITHETERALAEAENQRRSAQTQAERLETLEQLGTIGREITRNLDLPSIFSALDTHVHALLDATAVVIYRLAADRRTLAMAFGVEAGRTLTLTLQDIRMDDPDRHVARCAREGQEIVTHIAPGLDTAVAGTLETLSLMYAPLLVGGCLMGVMTIQSVQPHAYAEREVAIFRTLCAYGAIALANAEAQEQLVEKNRQLEIVSVSDRLTGLYNRLRLDQVLEEELARGDRMGAALSVILMDIDHFKVVNDTHGHQVGDQVLVAMATLLRAGSRGLDVVGRWGGEEFLVVCRDTALPGAALLAEKLRDLIAQHPFPQVGHKTGSFGVASRRDKESVDALISRVDAALYDAKNAGRNRVEVRT
jgi:diguanylate cyclase (GGDEF)-like protein